MSQFNIGDIIRQLEEAQKRANDANQQRYSQGLEELNAGRDSMRQYFAQANSLIQDIGTSAVEEINRGSERSFALGRQGLISSGLSNTTITGSLVRGTEEDRQRELQRVDEQKRTALGGLSERQASAEIGASGNIAGFIAARNDTGPDPASYAGLIRDAAAANTNPVTAQVGPGSIGGSFSRSGSSGSPGGFSSFGERGAGSTPGAPARIVTKSNPQGMAPGQFQQGRNQVNTQAPQSDAVQARLLTEQANKPKPQSISRSYRQSSGQTSRVA